MYKNKAKDGTNNLCGKNISRLRKQMIPSTSQRMLADQMQIHGIDIDKNAIQRIESGERFVTDIELKVFAEVFEVDSDKLLE